MKIAEVWHALPREIQEMVLSLVSKSDRLRMTSVCKGWKEFFRKEGLTINLSKRKNVDDNLVRLVMETCRDISFLNLSNCFHITDQSLETIGQFANPKTFKTLLISHCWGIKGPSINSLRSLTNLRVLDMSFFVHFEDITARSIVTECPFLVELDLTCTAVSNDAISILSELENIQKLILRECKFITDIALATINEKYKQIRDLNFRLCAITDPGLKYLRGCKSLKSLDMSACGLTSKAIRKFIVSCPQIENLDCFACPNVDDKCLSIVSQSPHLVSLNVSYCRPITPEGIQYMQNSTSLRKLIVVGCRKSVQETAIQFRKKVEVIRDVQQ